MCAPELESGMSSTNHRQYTSEDHTHNTDEAVDDSYASINFVTSKVKPVLSTLTQHDTDELLLTVDNVFPIMRILGLDVGDEGVFDLVRDAHVESFGKIDFSCFDQAISEQVSNQDDTLVDSLHMAFALLDTDGNGYVTVPEINHFLLKFDQSWTEEQVRKLLLSADFDGDGRINYQDFCMFLGYPDLATATRSEPLKRDEASNPPAETQPQSSEDRQSELIRTDTTHQSEPLSRTTTEFSYRLMRNRFVATHRRCSVDSQIDTVSTDCVQDIQDSDKNKYDSADTDSDLSRKSSSNGEDTRREQRMSRNVSIASSDYISTDSSLVYMGDNETDDTYSSKSITLSDVLLDDMTDSTFVADQARASAINHAGTGPLNRRHGTYTSHHSTHNSSSEETDSEDSDMVDVKDRISYFVKLSNMGELTDSDSNNSDSSGSCKLSDGRANTGNLRYPSGVKLHQVKIGSLSDDNMHTHMSNSAQCYSPQRHDSMYSFGRNGLLTRRNTVFNFNQLQQPTKPTTINNSSPPKTLPKDSIFMLRGRTLSRQSMSIYGGVESSNVNGRTSMQKCASSIKSSVDSVASSQDSGISSTHIDDAIKETGEHHISEAQANIMSRPTRITSDAPLRALSRSNVNLFRRCVSARLIDEHMSLRRRDSNLNREPRMSIHSIHVDGFNDTPVYATRSEPATPITTSSVYIPSPQTSDETVFRQRANTLPNTLLRNASHVTTRVPGRPRPTLHTLARSVLAFQSPWITNKSRSIITTTTNLRDNENSTRNNPRRSFSFSRSLERGSLLSSRSDVMNRQLEPDASNFDSVDTTNGPHKTRLINLELAPEAWGGGSPPVRRRRYTLPTRPRTARE